VVREVIPNEVCCVQDNCLCNIRSNNQPVPHPFVFKQEGHQNSIEYRKHDRENSRQHVEPLVISKAIPRVVIRANLVSVEVGNLHLDCLDKQQVLDGMHFFLLFETQDSYRANVDAEYQLQ
jgi:hypothetical protein